jgi:hypothetical protein
VKSRKGLPRPDFGGRECSNCRLPLGRYYDQVVRLALVTDGPLVCQDCKRRNAIVSAWVARRGGAA